MPTENDYEVGDTVTTQRGRVLEVTKKFYDPTMQLHGFDGIDEIGNSYWAWEYDIVSIERASCQDGDGCEHCG